MDTFKVISGDLGPLNKIMLRSDDTGESPDWHLTRVLVNDSNGKVYDFPANVWLSTEPGKALEVTLLEGKIYFCLCNKT